VCFPTTRINAFWTGRGQAFPFYDEKGHQVTVTVSKILELASEEVRYDDDRMIVAATRFTGTS
jgi:Polyphenol oxidase middle domain